MLLLPTGALASVGWGCRPPLSVQTPHFRWVAHLSGSELPGTVSLAPSFTTLTLPPLLATLLEFCLPGLDLFSAPQGWPWFQLLVLVLALPSPGSSRLA